MSFPEKSLHVEGIVETSVDKPRLVSDYAGQLPCLRSIKNFHIGDEKVNTVAKEQCFRDQDCL